MEYQRDRLATGMCPARYEAVAHLINHNIEHSAHNFIPPPNLHHYHVQHHPSPITTTKMSTNQRTDPKQNNMDSAPHQEIYETGLEMRKKVVGEDYVERALKNGSSDFARPLQQFATVSSFWVSILLLSRGILKRGRKEGHRP
jgi:hypothetical protein